MSAAPGDWRFSPGDRDEGWGAAIYLSNDDTMSLSSAQRVIWAIDHFAPIPREHVRPHELLNYFSFATDPVAHDRDFSIRANIAPSEEDPDTMVLGLAVQGRPISREDRRNANLSFVVDRSGSMAAEGRMDYLKQGLERSLSELKTGDIVNLVLFDTTTCHLAQNFVVGRDDMGRLRSLIHRIEPRGSTNLHDGLTRGYSAADRSYQPAYENRVVLVTDALANTGVTNEQLISLVGKHYDDRRIRLSGVGVGREFNDSLLDQLTERGKGAYVFLGSPDEVDAVFGDRFTSLIVTIANDVHFRLHLPPSLAMRTFYGEEASTVKERVQAIHYFAGTSQMFLSDLAAKDGAVPVTDDIMVSVEYDDAETGQKRVEQFVWNIGDIAGHAPNLDKAMLVTRFARELGHLAERPVPNGYSAHPRGWQDDDAYRRCATTRVELDGLAAGIHHDPEARRVKGLWDAFCSRYGTATPEAPMVEPRRPVPVRPRNNDYSPNRREQPQGRQPERNNDYAPADTWPSAQR